MKDIVFTRHCTTVSGYLNINAKSKFDSVLARAEAAMADGQATSPVYVAAAAA